MVSPPSSKEFVACSIVNYFFSIIAVLGLTRFQKVQKCFRQRYFISLAHKNRSHVKLHFTITVVLSLSLPTKKCTRKIPKLPRILRSALLFAVKLKIRRFEGAKKSSFEFSRLNRSHSISLCFIFK